MDFQFIIETRFRNGHMGKKVSQFYLLCRNTNKLLKYNKISFESFLLPLCLIQLWRCRISLCVFTMGAIIMHHISHEPLLWKTQVCFIWCHYMLLAFHLSNICLDEGLKSRNFSLHRPRLEFCFSCCFVVWVWGPFKQSWNYWHMSGLLKIIPLKYRISCFEKTRKC